jgi:hypothetical protein
MIQIVSNLHHICTDTIINALIKRKIHFLDQKIPLSSHHMMYTVGQSYRVDSRGNAHVSRPRHHIFTALLALDKQKTDANPAAFPFTAAFISLPRAEHNLLSATDKPLFILKENERAQFST